MKHHRTGRVAHGRGFPLQALAAAVMVSLGTTAPTVHATPRDGLEPAAVSPAWTAPLLRREMVFVDRRVPDYGKVLAAIRPGAEVVLLDPDEDGLAQIAAVVRRRSNLSAIHLISHGRPGALHLGSSELDAHAIAARGIEMTAIRAVLARGGDLLLYGCNAGQGSEGRAFVTALAAATGADVAASDDLTGKHGDWALEITSGRVDRRAAVDVAALAAYDFDLAVVANGNDTGAGSLRTAIASAASGETITFSGDTTVSLSSLAIDNNPGKNDDSALYINQNLTIDGSGHTVVIDANSIGRVFYIAAGRTVTLKNVTLREGLLSGRGGNSANAAQEALGAGIYNAGTLTLDGVTLTANAATGGGGGGGVAGAYVGSAGGGGSGFNGTGGGNGGDAIAPSAGGGCAGNYCGVAGGTGSGGNGGGFDLNAGGRGGTGGGGGAPGDMSAYSYGTGGAGGTATAGGFTVGGGGAGAGWDGVGGSGGRAVGAIHNTGTLTVINTSPITNNLAAGGGGGGSVSNVGGDGGRAIGGIWNAGGTVRITAANYADMSNANGHGAGGAGTTAGTTPAGTDRIYNVGGSVDTGYVYVPPPTTTVTSASLSADTGTSDTDWVTYTALQTISGTLSANLVAGEKVQVSFNNGSSWSDATSAVGSNTWSVSTTLSGSDFFVARVYNAGGAGPSTAHSYDLDQTGPTITFSSLALSADTGTSAADFITRTAAQTITGTLSAGLAVGDVVRGSVDAGSNWTDITGKVSGTALSWNGATLSGSSEIYLIVYDLAGNGGTITNKAYTLDTTAPTVTSITRQTPAGALTNANSLVFRVTFGEGVGNVTTGDFAPSGTTAGATGVAAGSASQYDVTVSGGDLAALDGTVSLAFAGGQDITDVAGNALTNTTPTGANDSYTLDNTAPGAATGALSVAENAANGTAVGSVVASDVSAVAYSLTDAAGGRFAISAGGAVTVADGSLLDYESATSHSITIRSTDAAGNSSDTLRSVTITNVNDLAPVITEGAGPLAVTMSEDSTPTVFAQTLHATDADGATTFTWSVTSAAGHGTATASGTGSAKDISYIPTANYNGSDSFTVRVSDGTNTDSVQINVTIDAVNDAPIINEGASTSFTTAEDTSHDLTLTGTDVDGQPLTWSLTAAPAHGGVGFAGGAAASKTFTYTPTANYNGADSFEVTLSDGTVTDSITVNVTVTAANDAPVITEGAGPVTSTMWEDGAPLTLTLHATDADTGTTLTWSISSAASHGTATASGTGTSKSISYTPDANFNGSDSFVVRVSDGTATDSMQFNVTVNAVDDPPVITQGASTTLTVLEDSNGVRTLTATEADGEAVTWGSDVAPTHGSVDFPGGTGLSKGYTYTPDADYNGTDTFRATATDGTTTDTIDVDVTVTPVNDEPGFTAGGDVTVNSESGAAYIGAGWALGLSAGPADEAGQLLTFVASNDNHALFAVQPYVDATGALRFTPVAYAAGTATVTLYLTDDGGTANGGDNQSPSVTFDITLTSTGIPAPVFSPAGGTFKGRAEVTLTAATAGASIRYTTDGTTPSETNGTEVASGTSIILIHDTHLAAIAYVSGRPHSAVTEADYRVKGGSGAFGFGALFGLALLAWRRRFAV
jgi:hypothetical protein